MTTAPTSEPDDAANSPSNDKGADASREKKTPKTSRSPVKFGSPKHCVDLTLAVNNTKGIGLTILAAASGSSNESVANVALALITNFSRAKSVLSTAQEIATADPMESGILAIECANEDSALFKLVWSMARVLNDTMPSQVPPTKAKSGLELAKGLQSLSDDARVALRRAETVIS
jgi:hypothetical protein